MKHRQHGPLIRDRVLELRKIGTANERQALDIAGGNRPITKSWVLAKLKEIADLAINGGSLSAANKAIELIGKEIGMFVDKSETKITLDSLSLADLEALAAELESDPEVQAALSEQQALLTFEPEIENGC
jgi:hypothetical protein